MALIRRPRRTGADVAVPPTVPVVPPPACTAQLEAFSPSPPTDAPSRRRKRASGAHKGPEDFIGKTDPAKVKERKRYDFGEARIQKAAAELDVVIESGDWSKARPIHFVALYARMHKLVYEVDAVWSGEDRRRFAMLVGGVIRRHFGGEPGRFADYMRWVWRREKRTEKWRRDNGAPGRVIGWALQCSTKLINEYVVNVGARGRD